ncbi:unnamed protein product, partial [Didymodactylos carnosus]
HDPGIFRSPFPLPANFFSDDDYFIITSTNDPLTVWYNQGWWGNPSGAGHCNIMGGPGYVWPALNCDGYAFDPDAQYPYGGTDIYLSPGALLAIPSSIAVNVTTVPGQKMLFVLRNYGGYLCDDTYYSRGTVCTEHGVTDEFQVAYGYAFDSGPTGLGAAWYADMLALFQALHVVINNRQNTIGGGGTPLQSLAPPVCPVGVQSSGRGVKVQVITFILTLFSCMNIYSFY